MLYKIKRFLKHCLYPFQFIGAAFILGFFRLFPFKVASEIGGRLARAVGPFLKQSRIARRNLKQAFPEKNEEDFTEIIEKMWENLGRTTAEYMTLRNQNLWSDTSPVEIVNSDLLDQIHHDGKPAIFVLGHIGNWEYATLPALQKGIPITQLYRTLNNPYIAFLASRIHGSITQDLVTKSPEGARKMLQVLREGGNLSMLVDQKLREGVAVPFFGRDAMTPQAPAKLALKFQCPLIPVRVERLSGIQCRLTYYPPLELPTEGSLSDRVYDVTLKMNQTFESWIRERPEQWIWMHNRWPKDAQRTCPKDI